MNASSSALSQGDKLEQSAALTTELSNKALEGAGSAGSAMHSVLEDTRSLEEKLDAIADHGLPEPAQSRKAALSTKRPQQSSR